MNTPKRQGSRARRQAERMRADGEDDAPDGRGREGESPREEEAQESQEGVRRQRCGARLPNAQGDQTPEARPRRTSGPGRGGDHRRAVHDPELAGNAKGFPANARPPPSRKAKERQGAGETSTARTVEVVLVA